MAVVVCPKCSTNLKIPDGASGNVKCPKCASIFPTAAKPAKPAAPSFEIVDAAPAPKPAAKPKPLEPEFEVVDDPKPKRRSRNDDDDYDDRPRSKRRRDDDDDYDDRPRKKKGRRDYDDDDDWQPVANRGAFGPAKVGMLMVSISLWIYMGTFALLAFLVLISWLGVSIPAGLMIVPGLLGLANWIVALIGLGFCIAGPAKSRGLAIAATAVAAVHLIMVFVVANNEKSAKFHFGSIQILSGVRLGERYIAVGNKMQKAQSPIEREALLKEFSEIAEAERNSGWGKKEDMNWQAISSVMPCSDLLIGILSYESKAFTDYILALLSGLLEVARLVLIVLLIGSVARVARERDTADKSRVAAFIAGGASLAAMVVIVLVMVIVEESLSGTGKTQEATGKAVKGALTWRVLSELFVYAIHIGSLIMPAVLSLQAKNAAARRSR